MLLNAFWMSAWVTPMPASQDFRPLQFGLELIGVLRHQAANCAMPMMAATNSPITMA